MKRPYSYGYAFVDFVFTHLRICLNRDGWGDVRRESGDGEEFVGLEGEAPAGIGEAVGDGGGGDGGVARGVAGVARLQGVVRGNGRCGALHRR